MDQQIEHDLSGQFGERLLKGPVIVFAAEPGDEIVGCSCALRNLVIKKQDILLVVVSQDDRDISEATLSAQQCKDRKAACKSAAEILGYAEPVFWNLSEPSLLYTEDIVQRILTAIVNFDASLVYAPSLNELRHDRFALGLAAREAVRRKGKDCALAYYGVDVPVTANVALDIVDVSGKQLAMACFVADGADPVNLASCFRVNGVAGQNRQSQGSIEHYNFLSSQRVLQPIPRLSAHRQWNRVATPQTAAPLVSVLIRTTGREELADALDSVAAQTYPAIEVVLVDVEGHGSLNAGEWCGRFPMRTISREQHLSRGAAANAGLNSAKGDYLVFLDDDDWFLPDHVHALVSAVTGTGEARAAYTGIECRRRKAAEYWDVLHTYNDWYDPFRLLVENYIPIHAVLFDRGLLGVRLCFDETLEVYEDWDFWIQLSSLTPLMHVDRVTAIYRISDTSGFGQHPNNPSTKRGYSALMQKWRSRWSIRQLVVIAQRAAKLPAETARVRMLERVAAERDEWFSERLRQVVVAHEAQVAELEQTASAHRVRIAELERSVAQSEARARTLQATLTVNLEQQRKTREQRNQVLHRLNGIQSSASEQLVRPMRALESRCPGFMRGLIALPKLIWWTLTLRLRKRLRVRRRANQLLANGLFDSAWYVEKNPEVVLSGLIPIYHWLTFGWAEGRDPNPFFDTRWYLAQHPMLLEKGINPLVHYLEHGLSPGCNPSPLFDASDYLRHNPEVADGGLNPLSHYLATRAGRIATPEINAH